MVDLVHTEPVYESDDEDQGELKKLDEATWNNWLQSGHLKKYEKIFHNMVYRKGMEHSIRKRVWPFLIGHYTFDMSDIERQQKDERTVEEYERRIEEWRPFEEFISLREAKKAKKLGVCCATETEPPINTESGIFSGDVSTVSPIKDIESLPKSLDKNLFTKKPPNSTPISVNANKSVPNKGSLFKFNLLGHMNTKTSERDVNDNSKSLLLRKDSSLSNDVFMEEAQGSSFQLFSRFSAKNLLNKIMLKNQDIESTERIEEESEKKVNENQTIIEDEAMAREIAKNFVNKVITEAINQLEDKQEPQEETKIEPNKDDDPELNNERFMPCLADKELVENFALNIHRIDKDVTRCDRNYWYFVSNENLVKLKNIMYT